MASKKKAAKNKVWGRILFLIIAVGAPFVAANSYLDNSPGAELVSYEHGTQIAPPIESPGVATAPPVVAGAPLKAPSKAVGPYSGKQLTYATIIVQTGREMGLSKRAWIIAIATAMQESTLHNYGNPIYPETMSDPRHEVTPKGRYDADSVGLFQQRPKWKWCEPLQCLDAAFAARAFYAALAAKVIKGNPNWESIPLTEAAQTVQGSAYGSYYAKHEGNATKMVNAIMAANGL